MMADLQDVYDMAQSILQTVNETAAEFGVTLPVRQYVAVGDAGDTVHDCAQVTVAFGALGDGLPASDTAMPPYCINPRTATYVVEIVRDIPKMQNSNTRVNTIPAAKIEETSKMQMQDASLLAMVAQRVKAGLPTRTAVYSVSPGAPMGAVQGMLLELQVGLI